MAHEVGNAHTAVGVDLRDVAAGGSARDEGVGRGGRINVAVIPDDGGYHIRISSEPGQGTTVEVLVHRGRPVLPQNAPA
jgi:hypothetical protein